MLRTVRDAERYNFSGLIDYDQVEALAVENKPAIIVAGGSAYSRQIDFARFRAIADKVGALLFVDMAHVAGLVAAGLEVVYSTTDPPLKAVRKVIPPLNLGQIRLDLGFMVLLIGVVILRGIAQSLAY